MVGLPTTSSGVIPWIETLIGSNSSSGSTNILRRFTGTPALKWNQPDGADACHVRVGGLDVHAKEVSSNRGSTSIIRRGLGWHRRSWHDHARQIRRGLQV
jgi:hypothetical protein